MLCAAARNLAQARRHEAHVFAYQFSKPMPYWRTGPTTFAGHSAEIPFVFGTPYTLGIDTVALAAKVSKYWIQFATSGAPSSFVEA